MAYKAYMFPFTDLSVTTWFGHVVNFFADVGWELHDDIGATEKVWKTQGESGDRMTLYLYLKRVSSTVQCYPTVWWNTTTHTGGPYAYGCNIMAPSSGGPYMAFLAGDKDLVLLSTNWAATSGGPASYFGAFPNALSTKYTTLTDDVEDGSNVSLPVVSSAGYSVGMKVQIVGIAGEGRDKLTISDVPDSTHIVVAALPRDYGTGAAVGFYPATGGHGYQILSDFYCICHPDDTGTTTGNRVWSQTDLLASYNALHPLSGRRQLSPAILYNGGAVVGIASVNGPLVSYSTSPGDILFVMNDGSYPPTSSVTSATATVVTDTAMAWTPDTLIGKYFVISNGTGIGQISKIIDNDATTLTVGSNFLTTPDVTSEYKIVDSLYVRLYSGAWKVGETTAPPVPEP